MYFLYHILLVLDFAHRNRGWKLEDDSGNDLDHHFKVCHSGHLSGGDDGQGGPAALVPEEDSSLQECQRSELPPQVCSPPFTMLQYRIVY